MILWRNQGHAQSQSHLRARVNPRLFVLSCLAVSVMMHLITVKLSPNPSGELTQLERFQLELRACQTAHATTPGKCALFGKIQVVDASADVKVQVVDAFPDLRVQVVKAFPDEPGKWQFVKSFPSYKIQYVTAFPDVKVKFVNAFPGCN